jgi:hypothetical protein
MGAVETVCFAVVPDFARNTRLPHPKFRVQYPLWLGDSVAKNHISACICVHLRLS